jgi:hypothetical protein
MQHLVSVIHDSTELATPAEMAAIGVFNDRLQSDGHWVFAGGPDTALKLAAEGSKACNRKVEVRPLLVQ